MPHSYFKSIHNPHWLPSQPKDQHPAFSILDLPKSPNIHYATDKELDRIVDDLGKTPVTWPDYAYAAGDCDVDTVDTKPYLEEVWDKGFYLIAAGLTQFIGISFTGRDRIWIREYENGALKLFSDKISGPIRRGKMLREVIIDLQLWIHQDQDVSAMRLLPIDKVELHTNETLLPRAKLLQEMQMVGLRKIAQKTVREYEKKQQKKSRR